MSLKKTEADISFWDRQRGVVHSQNGGWIIGDGVYCHGYNMMEDLVGQVTYMQVLVLNATGRLPSKRIADWIEAIHICLSWPDPRIWCNQVGALAGCIQTSPVAATVAGVLAADSRSYGIKPLKEGVGFIQHAMSKYKNGILVKNIVKQECEKHGGKPHIMGYARPIAKGDERVVAMENLSDKLQFENGEHLSLAYEIEKVLMEEFDEGMNINGYMSAFLSDQGYSQDEVYRIFSVLVNSGVTACYIDAFDKPAETFLPWRCDDINYKGEPPRKLAVR